MAPKVKTHHLQITRDALAFAIGAGLLINEAVTGLDRPNIIMAATTLMATAAYLAGTRSAKGGGND